MKVMQQTSIFIRFMVLSICILPIQLLAQVKPKPQASGQQEKVDDYLREKMATRHIPGLSLAVVRDGRVIFAKGYGLANLELSVPATDKTNFPIYSITKSFTAIATMMLVEDGKILLDDPVAKHLPGISPAGRSVTIRQLLNHTSGITNYDDRPLIPAEEVFDGTLPDWEKWAATFTMTSAPGERWEYGSIGYFLLGRLIEKISGKTYESFLQERIFSPLAMSETRLQNFDHLVPNRAAGYSWKAGAYLNAGRINPATEFSGGGLVSTVQDMAKWDAALYSEKLLKQASLEEMWTNAKLNNGQSVPSYGLGFGLTPFRGHKRIGHSGSGPGFVTAYSRFNDKKVTVILFANADHEQIKIGEMANEIATFYFSL